MGPRSPGRAPFSAGWEHHVQGVDDVWDTRVSSLLHCPLTSPALGPMLSLPSCLLATQNQGYAQLCRHLRPLITVWVCVSFLFLQSVEMIPKLISMSL